jgi:hypothetical protein
MTPPRPHRPQPGSQAQHQRVLRIGVILGGNIIEERLVRRREDVSVGQSAKNTFSVPVEGLARQWTMFAVESGRYFLRFTDKMDGRVSDGEGVRTLDSLKNRGAERRGDHWVLPLGDRSRGKLTLGDMTLLFQFVAAPPLQARPRLPASVRGSLADRIDPRLAIIMALSILIHFTIAITALFHDATLQTRTDRLHRQFVEDRFEERTVQLFDMPATGTVAEEPGGEGEAEPEEPSEPTRVVVDRRPSPDRGADTGGSPDDAAIAEAIANTALVSTLTGGEGEEGRYSKMREVDQGAGLDRAIDNVKKSGAQVAAVGATGDRRQRGPRTGEVGTDRGPGVSGPDTTTGTGAGARKEEVVSRVRFTGGTALEDTTLDPDDVVRRIRAQYLAGIRRCHERVLKTDPKAGGRVNLRFTIGPVGRITRSDVKGFDGTVDNCIKGLMGGWRFAIPKQKGGQATSAEFMIPLILQPGGG